MPDAAPAAPAPLSPLLLQATALARRADAAVAATGREELRAELAAELGRPAGQPLSVVLCGEAGRGKSSLAGALVDQPGLLPTSADHGSAVQVLLRRPAEDDVAGVGLVHRAQGNRMRVALDDLAPWITEPLAGEQRVRYAEVHLDHPLLASGLTLVDTVGLGGAHPSADAGVAAAVAAADAAVVVTSAGAPLSAGELGLARAAARLAGGVVVAVTHIDQHPGWREIVRDDALLLESLEGAHPIEVFGVSPRMYARAVRLRDASGVPALRERLLAWAGVTAGALQALRLCRTSARAVARAAAAEREFTLRAHADAAELKRRGGELTRMRDGLVREVPVLRRRLHNEGRLVQKEVDTELGRRLGVARAELLDGGGRGGSGDLEQEIEVRLADVLRGTLKLLADRLDELAGEFDDALSFCEVVVSQGLRRSAVPAAPRVGLATPPPGGVGPLDILARSPLVASALLLGSPVYAVALLAGIGLEIGRTVRRTHRDRLSRQLTETLAQIRADLSSIVMRAAVDGHAQLTEAFEGATRRRQEDLDAQIARVRSELAQAGPDRAREVARAKERLTELDSVAERLREIGDAAQAASRSRSLVQSAP